MCLCLSMIGESCICQLGANQFVLPRKGVGWQKLKMCIWLCVSVLAVSDFCQLRPVFKYSILREFVWLFPDFIAWKKQNFNWLVISCFVNLHTLIRGTHWRCQENNLNILFSKLLRDAASPITIFATDLLLIHRTHNQPTDFSFPEDSRIAVSLWQAL